MPIIEALREGLHGVTLALPEPLEVVNNESTSANLVDRAQGVGWYVFMFPGVHLELGDDTLTSLRRDAAYHAQYLFDTMSRTDGVDHEPPARAPLIACERVTVDGTAALSVMHRMAQRPGREIVMGHLLVPISAGLFEARWLTFSEMTGMRESALLMRGIDAAGPDADPEAVMRSIDYDAVEHDDRFPDHVLSISRRAERWIRCDAGLRVRDRPTARAGGEIRLDDLGCSITPPPRFALDGVEAKLATFHRVSLAGNDGVQFFFVQRRRHPERALESTARTALEQWGMTPISVEPRTPRAPLGAMVVAEGEHEADRMRIVTACVEDASLTMITTPAQPLDVVEEELSATAASYRADRRPWWRVW